MTTNEKSWVIGISSINVSTRQDSSRGVGTLSGLFLFSTAQRVIKNSCHRGGEYCIVFCVSVVNYFEMVSFSDEKSSSVNLCLPLTKYSVISNLFITRNFGVGAVEDFFKAFLLLIVSGIIP